MKDKIIICKQCERSFIIKPSEQERLLSKGFGFPTRCPECRNHKSKISDDVIGDSKKKGKKKYRGRDVMKEWV